MFAQVHEFTNSLTVVIWILEVYTLPKVGDGLREREWERARERGKQLICPITEWYGFSSGLVANLSIFLSFFLSLSSLSLSTLPSLSLSLSLLSLSICLTVCLIKGRWMSYWNMWLLVYVMGDVSSILLMLLKNSFTDVSTSIKKTTTEWRKQAGIHSINQLSHCSSGKLESFCHHLHCDS